MTLANAPMLLNDEQMQRFIRDGGLLLNTDFPKEFHDRLLAQLNEVYDKEGNPGNNILPRIRELQQVFDHPVITGALTSVLGPDYLLHTHRHGHFNAFPKPGAWHKDSYWGYDRIRNHHPWWAMIMYFPQDTPVELGPTGVCPGTHYHETRIFDQENPASEVTANGKAGTFALIHYDIWHRSTANLLGTSRYMLKFEFTRTTSPKAPSWDNRSSSWSAPDDRSFSMPDHSVIWEENWNWLSGRIGSLSHTQAEDNSVIRELAGQLESSNEPLALNAAYGLACRGEAGIAVLLKALRNTEAVVSRMAAYGLSISGKGAVSGLREALSEENEVTVSHAAFALGELRALAADAVPELCDLLTSRSDKVRRTAVEAIGLIGRPAEMIVSALVKGLGDEDDQVRFTAALSLLRMGKVASAAVPVLAEALRDPNRYVRGHAAEALRFIDTEEARDILFRELLNLRWCSDTTSISTF